MVDFILNMPVSFFARVFGNPAGDPVLVKSRGVTLLRDSISKLSRKKDCMTLPALEKGIQKVHTPSAETIMVDFVYNIKEWIEACLNNIENHVYPHSYRFSKRDGKGEMKYKAWAKDKNWLPEGKSLRMLHSIPKGTPRLLKPDTRKLLDIKQLEDCVAKCKRLTAADRN